MRPYHKGERVREVHDLHVVNAVPPGLQLLHKAAGIAAKPVDCGKHCICRHHVAGTLELIARRIFYLLRVEGVTVSRFGLVCGREHGNDLEVHGARVGADCNAAGVPAASQEVVAVAAIWHAVVHEPVHDDVFS